MVFVAAVLSGAIVRLTYRCISCFRQVVNHRAIAVEVEDLIFWVSSAVYMFVQIYHTSDGSIRWYFILGVVLGAVLMTIFLQGIEKMYKKIYARKKEKVSSKT